MKSLFFIFFFWYVCLYLYGLDILYKVLWDWHVLRNQSSFKNKEKKKTIKNINFSFTTNKSYRLIQICFYYNKSFVVP